jgi:hypothetical protein
MITDVVSVGQLRAEDNLADALKRNRELKAALLELHRPRKVAGGQIRCTECAVYVSGALRRMDWPCRTARALGVDT